MGSMAITGRFLEANGNKSQLFLFLFGVTKEIKTYDFDTFGRLLLIFDFFTYGFVFDLQGELLQGLRSEDVFA